MNIQMQTGGILILLLLLYFYKRQGNLGLYTGRIFLRVLYVTILCLTLDILSIILIVHQASLPLLLVELECKIYLTSLVVSGYMALVYTEADIRHLAMADKFSRRMGLAVAVVSLLILLLPIHIFYEGGSVAYTYGPACSATYAGALILLLMTLFKLATQGKSMNPKRRSAIRLWLIIWIIAALLQFFNSKLLLVGFANAMGMVILFFELENPEIYINRDTGFFNNYALIEFIRQRYRKGMDCCGIMISLENIHINNILPSRIEAAMLEVIQFIRRLPDTTVFQTDSREFSLSFENLETLEKIRDMIFERFQNGWLENDKDSSETGPLLLQPHYLIIPSGSVAKNADEMLDMLRYFRVHCSDMPESHTLILDEASITEKRQREEILSILVQAIAEDHIEAFYQPIYSTTEKKFISAEALARIRRPDGSIVPPGLFIPVAEDTGLITKVGEIMFDKVCRFIRDNDMERYGLRYIEINLSVVQCENGTLAGTFIDIMEKYKIPPQYINLEITESASIGTQKILLENMHTLIDYGAAFSLDDFGCGQSNLNYIMSMPVQIVKFDRNMTQAYFKNQKARYILQGTTTMVHEMQLEVVSEGVETRQELEELERLGIDYIQGFYFSRPIDENAFLQFLTEKNA